MIKFSRIKTQSEKSLLKKKTLFCTLKDISWSDIPLSDSGGQGNAVQSNYLVKNHVPQISELNKNWWVKVLFETSAFQLCAQSTL